MPSFEVRRRDHADRLRHRALVVEHDGPTPYLGSAAMMRDAAESACEV